MDAADRKTLAAPSPPSAAKRLGVGLMIGLPLLSVLAYVTLQRGPIRAFDCWFADDIALSVERPEMPLGEFRAAVKDYTRNCISVEVVSGPTDDNAIVSSPERTSWIFYRGDYSLEISTVPASG